MARAIAELAQAQGIEVIHLSQKFERNTRDVDWIRQLHEDHEDEEDDWIIVSGDTRISRSKAERATWHESRLTAFFLDNGWSSKKFWVQAAELVRWWPLILETSRKCSPGSGFLLPFKGSTPKQIYNP